jgi:alpha-D-xyloside xylohydrolase
VSPDPNARRVPAAHLVVLLLLISCGGTVPVAVSTVTIERSSDLVRIHSSAATAEIHLKPYRLELFRRAAAAPLTAETQEGGVFYERDGVRQQLTTVLTTQERDSGVEFAVATTEGEAATVAVRFLTARTVEVTVEPPHPEGVSAVGDRFDTPGDEHIYGLTERLRDSQPQPPNGLPIEEFKPVEVGSLDRRGETVEMYVRPTFSLYAPFYQSSRGYGLAVAGTTAGAFDIAKTDPRVLSFRFETATTAESRRLQLHLFVGPAYATILDEYTALTGRPLVPPAWAFRHWRWRDELALGAPGALDGTEVNAQVAEDVTMYDDLGIPAGVYIFDRPWTPGEFGFSRYTWDEQRLPNPTAMLAAMRRRGYKLVVWSSTWTCGSDPGDNGAEALRLGFLAPGASAPPHCANTGGSDFVLDVTNAAARAWWRDRITAFVTAYDIDGVRLDRGEEFLPSAATDVWSDGRNGREVHNDYPTLQAAIHYDALRAARGNDFVLWSRPGYTGTQRYAVFGGGDYPGSTVFGAGPGTDLGLRAAIIAQQRVAFMGFPIWGSDGGGNYEFRQRDVFARWIEFNTFSGLMVIGGTGNHAPWNMPTQPHYDQEMIDIYRRYTQLRADMQGYIADAAIAAGKTGLPVARPLVFDFADDPNVQDLWDEYLFGPDLLVAPVWRNGDRARDVYLPRGVWRSFWDDTQHYEGPTTITLDVPLDTIPVFVRGDAHITSQQLQAAD